MGILSKWYIPRKEHEEELKKYEKDRKDLLKKYGDLESDIRDLKGQLTPEVLERQKRVKTIKGSKEYQTTRALLDAYDFGLIINERGYNRVYTGTIPFVHTIRDALKEGLEKYASKDLFDAIPEILGHFPRAVTWAEGGSGSVETTAENLKARPLPQGDKDKIKNAVVNRIREQAEGIELLTKEEVGKINSALVCKAKHLNGIMSQLYVVSLEAKHPLAANIWVEVAKTIPELDYEKALER
jgi:hypothetical protein